MSKLIDAMKQVNDLNKTHGVTQRGGKKYTEVFVRVEAFRQAFGTELGIDTLILVDDGKRVVVKATIISKEGLTVGSGLAEEIRGQGNVNKTSALENAETSAIGRALASIGCTAAHMPASMRSMLCRVRQQRKVNRLNLRRRHQRHQPGIYSH